MTVLASDEFTRSDSTSLNGTGANWAHVAGENIFTVSSNTAVPEFLIGEVGDTWQVGVWPADQFSRIVIDQITGTADTSGIGASLRGPTNFATETLYRGYACAAATNNTCIAKTVAGVFTMLAQGTAPWAVGDEFQFDVKGTTLTVRRNGALVLQTTDAGIASGNPGVTYSATMTAAGIRSWEGGDFSEPTVVQSTGLVGTAGGVS